MQTCGLASDRVKRRIRPHSLSCLARGQRCRNSSQIFRFTSSSGWLLLERMRSVVPNLDDIIVVIHVAIGKRVESCPDFSLPINGGKSIVAS